MEVSRDGRLNATDLRVYCEMAHASRGAATSIGVRRIARLLGLGKSAVAESIRRLCEFGHLRPGLSGAGKRMVYAMVSAVFGDVGYIQGSGVPYIAKMEGSVKSAPRAYMGRKAAG